MTEGEHWTLYVDQTSILKKLVHVVNVVSTVENDKLWLRLENKVSREISHRIFCVFQIGFGVGAVCCVGCFDEEKIRGRWNNTIIYKTWHGLLFACDGGERDVTPSQHSPVSSQSQGWNNKQTVLALLFGVYSPPSNPTPPRIRSDYWLLNSISWYKY